MIWWLNKCQDAHSWEYIGGKNEGDRIFNHYVCRNCPAEEWREISQEEYAEIKVKTKQILAEIYGG